MKILDFAGVTPEVNLAMDEALVDALEEGEGEETLRFWESPAHFLVLGHGNRAATELQLDACERLGIPVLRRCSGGGAVLQGPGCFNYAVTLLVSGSGPLSHITTTNRHVMGRHQAAFARLLSRRVEVQGVTDLALAGCGDDPAVSGSAARAAIPSACGDCGAAPETAQASASLPPDAASGVSPSHIRQPEQADENLRWLKFSGNAQRRKRRALLFHGSFLLGLDMALLNQVLAHPSKEPDYRGQRTHADFLVNLTLPADAIKRALMDCWQAAGPLEAPPLARMRQLVEEKYSRREWNLKL